MKANKKYFFGAGLLIAIFYLTYRIIFADQRISEIIEDLQDASKGWLLIGALAAILFVACESCIIWYMLRVMHQRRGFLSCLKYSFLGFFFCYITPSSSGGQPAQMYYMKKDGVKIGTSALIMLLITIAYKSVLLIFGAGFLLIWHQEVFARAQSIFWLVIIGIILNAGFVALLIFTMRKPDTVRRTGIRFLTFLHCKKLLKTKRYQPAVDKINRICNNYRMSAAYLKKNRFHMLVIFLITAVQRLFLFAVTWIVYRSYGFSEVSFAEIIALQTAIAIAVEMLPLPGAAGITEGCFMVVYKDVFTPALVRPALLISRGLSFYLILILGGLVTLFAQLYELFRRKRPKPQ